MPRSRSRQSAKAAGARFETAVTDYLQKHYDDRVFRQTKTGRVDLGDVGGVRTPHNHKIALELKNEASVKLAGWAAEADRERENLGAVAGPVGVVLLAPLLDLAFALGLHLGQQAVDLGHSETLS